MFGDSETILGLGVVRMVSFSRPIDHQGTANAALKKNSLELCPVMTQHNRLVSNSVDAL